MAGAWVRNVYDGIREKVLDISFLGTDGAGTNLDIDYTTVGLTDFNEDPNDWSVTPVERAENSWHPIEITRANVARTGFRATVTVNPIGVGGAATVTYRVSMRVAPGYIR